MTTINRSLCRICKGELPDDNISYCQKCLHEFEISMELSRQEKLRFKYTMDYLDESVKFIHLMKAIRYIFDHQIIKDKYDDPKDRRKFEETMNALKTLYKDGGLFRVDLVRFIAHTNRVQYQLKHKLIDPEVVDPLLLHESSGTKLHIIFEEATNHHQRYQIVTPPQSSDGDNGLNNLFVWGDASGTLTFMHNEDMAEGLRMGGIRTNTGNPQLYSKHMDNTDYVKLVVEIYKDLNRGVVMFNPGFIKCKSLTNFIDTIIKTIFEIKIVHF